MADYPSLEVLLDSPDDMTVIRNNSKNDDGTDSVAGVPWFHFNGVVASTLFVNGNHWIGFGLSSAQLNVCNRDGAVYWVYRQEGTVKGTRFLKLRVEGYTQYNSTSTDRRLVFELFLFDDGNLFLNVVQTPTNGTYLGTSNFICGSKAAALSAITAGAVQVPYSFYAEDESGSVFQVLNEPMVIGTKQYAARGTVLYPITALSSMTQCRFVTLNWQESLPPGTQIEAYAALHDTSPVDGDFVPCVNGEPMVHLAGANFVGKTLYLQFVLSTTDRAVTPMLSGFDLRAEDVMVQDFVSTRMPYTYEVFCNLSDHPQGISITNLDFSRLRFATMERVSPFSVHMPVAGLVANLDLGYLYDQTPFPQLYTSLREAVTAPQLWPTRDIAPYYESVNFEWNPFGAVMEDCGLVLT